MVMVLHPLHKAFQIKRVVVSTYQSVTGTGAKAVKQLLEERSGKTASDAAYPYQIDLNVIPQIDVFLDNDYTKEEMKMVLETKKIMNNESLKLTATAVRIPVMGGHSESVNIEFEKPFEVDNIKKILSTSAGVIVEDDEASRLILENYISRIEFLELKASLTSGMEGYNYLVNNPNIDILLLDINMPEMSGMDLMKSVPILPETILITTESSFAVEAFELKALDYLVKPVQFERFAIAIHRAVDFIYFTKRTTGPDESLKEIYVKSNSKFYKLAYDDIYFVEALADYVLVYTENTRYIVYSTMKAIEEKLKGVTFVRVHRSYIINLRKIQFIEGNTVIVSGKHIPISKTYQDSLFAKLNFL
jgi:DNA-binding LytR/AlgR family response regulator